MSDWGMHNVPEMNAADLIRLMKETSANAKVISDEKYCVLKKAQSKIDAFNLAYPVGMRFVHRNSLGNLGNCKTLTEPYIHQVPFSGGFSYMPAVMVRCNEFPKVSVCVDDLTPIEPEEWTR